MGKHNPLRLTATVVSVVGFVISLVFNALAALGIGKIFLNVQCCIIEKLYISYKVIILYNLTKYIPSLSISLIGPYYTTTANVSAKFDTEITPSGWTFNIWTVIYIWLTAMIIYILAGLCRKFDHLFIFHCLKIMQVFLQISQKEWNNQFVSFPSRNIWKYGIYIPVWDTTCVYIYCLLHGETLRKCLDWPTVALLSCRNSYGYVYCSPAVLPYGFFISWCLNLCFNIGWLIVWDRE